MKDSLAILAIKISADAPDLAPFICAIIQGSAGLSTDHHNQHMMRLRATLKGVFERRLAVSDGFAALKVHVDDLADAV